MSILSRNKINVDYSYYANSDYEESSNNNNITIRIPIYNIN